MEEVYKIKMASYLHRTAQPFTLATFRSWGSSIGAGRIRLAGCKYRGIELEIIKFKSLRANYFEFEGIISMSTYSSKLNF